MTTIRQPDELRQFFSLLAIRLSQTNQSQVVIFLCVYINKLLYIFESSTANADIGTYWQD